MKKVAAAFGIALAILLITFLVFGKQVRVSSEEVQVFINSNFGEYEHSSFTGSFTSTSPTFKMKDDKAYVTFHFAGEVRLKGVAYFGTITFAGGVGWEKGGVTIIDPEVVEWKTSGVHPKLERVVKAFLSDALLRGLLKKHPFYIPTQEQKGKILPSLVRIRDVWIEDGSLMLELGYII